MKHILLPLLLLAGAAQAEAPVVEDAAAQKSGAVWRIQATLMHPDTGWDHYADGWRIEDASGTILGTRDLLHPHVDEQPFTRSLTGVALPDGTRTVYIRARCNLDGWSDETFALEISLSN